MRNAIKNTKGRVTVYGFACGCIESRMIDAENETRVVLWFEHGVYHVRAHSHGLGKRIFWDSFLTLKEARNRFNKA